MYTYRLDICIYICVYKYMYYVCMYIWGYHHVYVEIKDNL